MLGEPDYGYRLNDEEAEDLALFNPDPAGIDPESHIESDTARTKTASDETAAALSILPGLRRLSRWRS